MHMVFCFRFFENLRQSSTESDNSNCTLQKTGTVIIIIMIIIIIMMMMMMIIANEPAERRHKAGEAAAL